VWQYFIPPKTTYVFMGHIVVLGGLVVIILANGPKIDGFKPARVRWIFKDDVRVYGMLKIPAEYERYLVG
jgi:hypothetical protein